VIAVDILALHQSVGQPMCGHEIAKEDECAG